MFAVNFLIGVVVSGIICTLLAIGGEHFLRYGEQNELFEK